MKALCVPTFVVLALVSAVVPLSAHHSWPVSNDPDAAVQRASAHDMPLVDPIQQVGADCERQGQQQEGRRR